MYKIIHIHSDHKFVHEIEKYACDSYENVLLFIGEKSELLGRYTTQTIFLSAVKENNSKIISKCNEADLVVINYLSPYLQELLIRLDPNIKILWRFWRGDLPPRT